MGHEHRVWIERFSDRLRMPAWGGVLVLGAIAYVVYVASGFAIGDLGGDLGLIGFEPLVLVTLAIPVYVRRRMTSLEEYALTMVEDPKAATEQIPGIARTGPVLALAGVFFAGFVLPYLLLANGTQEVSVAYFVLAPLPYMLLVFTAATAVWTWAYSMVGIYRIGNLPMTLRPFTQDRTLGLRPFASACVGLTAVYYVFIGLEILSDVQDADLSLFFVLRDSALIGIGVGLFFLPLVSIHRVLVRAKSKELA